MYEDSENEDYSKKYNEQTDSSNESESDDGLMEIQEKASEEGDDDDEDDESDSEDDEGKKTKNNDEILHLWDEFLGISFNLNFLNIFLEDPELKLLWQEQKKESSEEEEEDDDESEIDFENIDQQEADSSPDTEEQREPSEKSLSSFSEEENEDAFSLHDVDTDREENIKTETPFEEAEKNEEPFELTSDYEEKLKELQREEEPGEVEEDNSKKYRKLPKTSTSDSSEYETIYSLSETEETKQNDEVDVEDEEETKREDKIQTPDPFSWVEYNKEIDYVDPFDGNWYENWLQPGNSAPSSLDESDHRDVADEKNKDSQYDLPTFELNPKRDAYENIDRPVEVKKVKRIKKVNRKKKLENTPQNIHDKQHDSKHDREQEKDQTYIELYDAVFEKKGQKYLLNLDVYNYHKYPKYRHYQKFRDSIKESVIHEEIIQSKPQAPVKEKQISINRTRSARERFLLKRKKRDLLYERLHPWYREIGKDEIDDLPDNEIPSYRTKKTGPKSRDQVIGVIVDMIVEHATELTHELEREKLNKEAYFCSRAIIDEICQNITVLHHEREKEDAVKYALEVILDSWEEHVYGTRLRIIESHLEYVSEEISKACLLSCFDEMIEEDIAATLLTRNILAESLDEEGMKRAKISRRLTRMFHDYNFHSFDFENSKKSKGKHKKYKDKKILDKILLNRLKKRELAEKEKINKVAKIKEEEQKPIQREKEMEQMREKIVAEKKRLQELEELRKKEEQKKLEDIERHEEESKVFSPLVVSPEISDTDELKNIPGYKKSSNRKTQVRTERISLRMKVVNLWLKSQSDLFEARRDEYLKNYIDSDIEEPEKDKSQSNPKQDDGKVNYDTNSENEDNIDANEISNRLQLPRLGITVKQALLINKAPDVITPKLKLIDGRPETPGKDRNDSALGSEIRSGGRERTKLEEVNEDDVSEKSNEAVLTTENEAIVADENENNEQRAIKRRESGFESDDETTDDDLVTKLSPHVSEEELGKEQMIKLIPNMDRDEYLHDWLDHRQTPNSKAAASLDPPKLKERVRKFRLKRPDSVLSVESSFEVVPLDEVFYEQARERRMRPLTASTTYTGRESSLTDIVDEKPEVEIESDNEIKNLKTYDGAIVSKIKRPENLIQFEKWKNDTKKHIIDTSDEMAWEFYKKQHDFLRSRSVYKSKNGQKTPEKLSPKSKNKIIKKHTKVTKKKTNSYLKMNLIPENENQPINFLPGEEGGTNNESSHSPTTTSWEYEGDRPLTPYSDDSDAELEELKRKYKEQLIKDRNERWREIENKDQRRWREFMRKKQLEDEMALENSKKSASTQKYSWLLRQNSSNLNSSNNSRESSRTSSDSRIQSTNGTAILHERQLYNTKIFTRLQIIPKPTKRKEKLLPRRSSQITANEIAANHNNRKIQSDGEYSRPPSTKGSKKSKKKSSLEKDVEKLVLPYISRPSAKKQKIKYSMP